MAAAWLLLRVLVAVWLLLRVLVAAWLLLPVLGVLAAAWLLLSVLGVLAVAVWLRVWLYRSDIPPIREPNGGDPGCYRGPGGRVGGLFTFS